MSEPDRLLDINVMLALTQPGHVHSESAHEWLAALPRGAKVATCSLTEAGFIRLMLNPAVAGKGQGLSSILAKVESISAPPLGTFLADTTSLRHAVVDATRLHGHQQVNDFHLVNLAATSNALLATFDRRIAEALAPEDRKYVELIPPAP